MTVSAPVELSGVSQATQRKNISGLIAAVSIGNALEWYDIAIYGYFAVYVSKAFFPNNDPTTSLLLTFGTFGLSFLVRPIGGVVLGAYADRHGRKASLMVSIVMMTIGTSVIAFWRRSPFSPPAWCRDFPPAVSSEVRPRFWSSIGRIVAGSSRAGNLPARGCPICWRPRSASASPHG
jgi:MFS family permease